MEGTITCVAAGWPTTFCDNTADRSSSGPTGCLRGRLCWLLGFSTLLSALSIAVANFLTRGRGRSPRRSGSFMKNLCAHIIQQFTGNRADTQNISNVAVTEIHTRFIELGSQYVWAGSYRDGMGRGVLDGNGTECGCYLCRKVIRPLVKRSEERRVGKE